MIICDVLLVSTSFYPSAFDWKCAKDSGSPALSAHESTRSVLFRHLGFKICTGYPSVRRKAGANSTSTSVLEGQHRQEKGWNSPLKG